MRKIVLLCAAGISTSLLVHKIQEAAKAVAYDCEVHAYPAGQYAKMGEGVDIILLGPQVRFYLPMVKGMFPEIPAEAVDIAAFGMLDGKRIIEQVKTALHDNI